MFDAFINSLIVTIPATVIPITIAAFAAYAFAWMRFPGRAILFAVVIGLLVVPLQMTLVPLLRLYNVMDLTGSYLGIWLAHAGFGLPLAIYLLYNYIAQLPKDIFESAFIDGASHYTAFTRLALPLSLPALASFAIFQFLWVWNDLLVALVFLGTDSEVAVLTSRLNELVGTRGEDWHVLTAGGLRDHGGAAAGVPRAPALLRPWAAGGLGQGMTAPESRIVLGFEGSDPPDWLVATEPEHRPAGFILGIYWNVEDAEQVRRLTTSLQALAPDPAEPFLLSADEEGGQLSAFTGITTPFPGAMALGATGDAESGAAGGRRLG